MKKLRMISLLVGVVSLALAVMSHAVIKGSLEFSIVGDATVSKTIAIEDVGAVGSVLVKFDTAVDGTFAVKVDRVTGFLMLTNGVIDLVTSNIVLFSESYTNRTTITWYPEGKTYLQLGDVLKTVQTGGTNGLAFIDITD